MPPAAVGQKLKFDNAGRCAASHALCLMQPTGQEMPEKRCFVVGAVSLVKCRIKGFGHAALTARNEIEPQLVLHGYMKTAPFEMISFIVRFGLRENLNPEIGDVGTKDRDLPVAVELCAKELEQMSAAELVAKCRLVMLDMLCDVAANFDLPYEFLDDLRARKVADQSPAAT